MRTSTIINPSVGVGLSVLIACALAPEVAAQCSGRARPATGYTTDHACPPSLSWTFRLDCVDECGNVYYSYPQTSAVANGACVNVPFPGQESSCVPSFAQKDHASGLYGVSSSFHEYILGGCQTGAAVITENNCPCAPSCSVPDPPETTPDDKDEWPSTPLILSVTDGEYALTSAADGVRFDLDADGTREQLSWTAAGSDEAFLVLDRDQDGVVDDGRELFGDASPQLPSAEPNGFRALAVFDDPMNGGNGDGWIDRRDPIFEHLALWLDGDHDGETDDGELRSLADGGVEAFHLDYRTTMRRDPHGNLFRYQADVIRSVGPGARVVWDVVFVAAGDD